MTLLPGLIFHEGLAKSPEMSMQIPLQKAVGKVLKVLEKMDLSDNEVTIDYLNSIGTFISNMLQWEHNEFIKQEKYDRLISSALRVIVQRGVDCAFVFGKILFWLYGYDRQRFEGYIKSFLTSDAVFVVESICKAPIHEDWQTSQRSILWGSFVSRLREVVIL